MSLQTAPSTPTPLNPNGPTNPLELTEAAIKKVKDFLTKSPEAEGKIFRVAVEGGGCSGYQYNFSLDIQKPDDLVIQCNDVQVLLDPQSKLYLHGSVVDFVEDFRGSGFSVKNPQSKGSCGCGVSFTV